MKEMTNKWQLVHVISKLRNVGKITSANKRSRERFTRFSHENKIYNQFLLALGWMCTFSVINLISIVLSQDKIYNTV